MPAKVSNLSMVGFRGSTSRAEFVFDPSKSITLVFGENGTGKSTIVDAFDFVCNQALGSLENYSLGGQTKKYVASLNYNPAEVKVCLSCGPSKWTAILGKEGPAVTPSGGCPDARILRRKSILDLIEEQPKKRFEALKSFIAVPGIERSENALRDKVRTMESDYGEAVRSLTQANEALERLWADEGKPGKQAVEWAKAESEKDVTRLQTDVTEITDIETAFQKAHTSLSVLDNALLELKSADKLHSTALEQQKSAEKKQIRKNTQLVNLLQEAKTYITQKAPLTQCPVCEQEIDPMSLSKRLDERIDEMSDLALLAKTTSQARTNTETKTLLAYRAQKDFCQKTKELGNLLKSSTLTEVKACQLNWKTFEMLLSHEQASDEVEKQGRELKSIASDLRPGLLTRKDGSQKSINQHNAIKGHIETLIQKAQEAITLEALVKKLKKTLEIVSQQRKNYVDEVLMGIAAEVRELYLKLHPNENIGNFRFFLKPSAIGSLEFDGQFHDCCEIPPQAYYSESHLDTLGICVFLALAKRFKKDNTLVILDDVFTSVDSTHLDRFMALLHEEATNFNQLVITTHYRPWRDRYRWAKGPTANTQVIELGPWTLQNGLQAGQFLTALAELSEHLLQMTCDRQVVASKAGIVLESLLDFLTLKYRCAIPRNARNDFTLGDLASGIDSKLGKELRISKPSKASGAKTDTNIVLKPLIDACTSEQWIRNAVGCHFSALGSEVTDGDVRKFGENVLALATQLICDSCGTLPTRRPSGSYWQCKCGKLKLYPLIYPGSDPTSVDDES